MAASIIDPVLKNNYIANGLSGPVFQAAIENRGVFENIEGNNVIGAKAGAMYMCTGKTIEIKDKAATYNIPEVIAVEGPENPPKDGNKDYKINITFDKDGKIKSAKLVPVQ